MHYSHAQITRYSQIKYLEQLQESQNGASAALGAVIDALMQSGMAALEKDKGFTFADMPFSGLMVSDLPVEQREALVNQHALGLGKADAPILFIGTEHAYDLERTLPLNLEGIGLTLQWLCGGKREIIEKIGGYDWPHPVPFHIYPNLQYRVDQNPGQHTWIVISSILGRVYDLANYKELLTGYQPGLGDYAYQVEMSAYPSRKAHKGKSPSAERLAFLGELLAAMRSTAKVVIFHGKPSDKRWNAMRLPLVRRFLDLPEDSEIDFTEETAAGVKIKTTTNQGLRVMITRALNGNVSNVYRDLVAQRIEEVL